MILNVLLWQIALYNLINRLFPRKPLLVANRSFGALFQKVLLNFQRIILTDTRIFMVIGFVKYHHRTPTYPVSKADVVGLPFPFAE
jgi:hypothetical protein